MALQGGEVGIIDYQKIVFSHADSNTVGADAVFGAAAHGAECTRGVLKHCCACSVVKVNPGDSTGSNLAAAATTKTPAEKSTQAFDVRHILRAFNQRTCWHLCLLLYVLVANDMQPVREILADVNNLVNLLSDPPLLY